MKLKIILSATVLMMFITLNSNEAHALQQPCMNMDPGQMDPDGGGGNNNGGQQQPCSGGEAYFGPMCDFPQSQCNDYIQPANRSQCNLDYPVQCSEIYQAPDCGQTVSQCDIYTTMSNIVRCNDDYTAVCTAPPAVRAEQDVYLKDTLTEVTPAELERIIVPSFSALLGFAIPSVETMTRHTLGATTITNPADSHTGSSVVPSSFSAMSRTGVPQTFGPIATAAATTALMYKGSQLPMSTQQAVPPYNNLPKFDTITRTGQQHLYLNIQTTCFPTNLRGVSNPISASADLILKGKYFVYKDSGTAPTPAAADYKTFEVRYPARAAIHGNAGSVPINLTGPGLSFEDIGSGLIPQAYLLSKLVTVKVPSVFSATYDVNSNSIVANTNRFLIKDISFSQVVPPVTAAQLVEYTSVARWQAAIVNYKAQTGNPGIPEWMWYENWKNSIISGVYMGQSGPVGQDGGSSVSVTQSNDGTSYDIKASLPGDLTMCDGYYSPLMVFFDEKRPHFANISEFKMNHSYKTYWPEAGHHGYFVGLPNKSGKIDSYEDLFGEDGKYKNGFEKLAQFDKNKDGRIDLKDPIFKKLVLWKDKKGSGQFNKQDSIKLSSKIKSINLKYSDSIQHVSIGAEYRQKSTFVFRDQGKVKQGEIIDVWFKPVLNEMKSELAGK